MKIKRENRARRLKTENEKGVWVDFFFFEKKMW